MNMTALREPLYRWRNPQNALLRGQVFPRDNPPFGPFPTVTNIINANLCPRALVHSLFHGFSNALNMYSFDGISRGDLFHGFCAYLKWLIHTGEIEIQEGRFPYTIERIHEEFRRFCQRESLPGGEVEGIWREYINPWITRKLEVGELNTIPDEEIFFELYIATTDLSLELGDGIRHYPLRGRIDEINISRRVIIERTIRPATTDGQPPFLKDFQIWLLNRLLLSLNNNQLPEGWNADRFTDYTLIVETPQDDYVINPDQPDFINDTHSAYAWLDDLARTENPSVFREVSENQACSPEIHHEHCVHAGGKCFRRVYSHPISRPEIRRGFQPWYRRLLWERMWNEDLWHYRLLHFPIDELIDMRYIMEVPIQGREDNELQLGLSNEDTTALGDYNFVILSFGTLNCGLRLQGRISPNTTDGTKVIVSRDWQRFSNQVFVLSPESTTPMFKEPLTWMEPMKQRNLFLRIMINRPFPSHI